MKGGFSIVKNERRRGKSYAGKVIFPLAFLLHFRVNYSAVSGFHPCDIAKQQESGNAEGVKEDEAGCCRALP